MESKRIEMTKTKNSGKNKGKIIAKTKSAEEILDKKEKYTEKAANTRTKQKQTEKNSRKYWEITQKQKISKK